MAELYRSSDVLLKLSKVEGMFGPPLEAFHCGATAVCSIVTGCDEYLVHGWNGLLTMPGDDEAVRRSLTLLNEDRRFLHYLKYNSLTTARAWPTWDQASRFMAVALEQIVKGHRPVEPHQAMLVPMLLEQSREQERSQQERRWQERREREHREQERILAEGRLEVAETGLIQPVGYYQGSKLDALPRFRRSLSWLRNIGLRLKNYRDLDMISRSPFFNRRWYLYTYPDVARAGEDPVLHYFVHGGKEGRRPGPFFDGKFYLDRYPDVAASGMNPLLHYIRFGQAEKRKIRIV
jgi:hypothetical protein